MHSYLDLDNGERVADAIEGYEGSGAGAVMNPRGICADTRNDGYIDRHYFFITMPDSHKIKRYYYNETDEEIYYDSYITIGTSLTPEAVSFCEGDNGDWLVYADPLHSKVGIHYLSSSIVVQEVYTASNIGGMRHPLSVAIANTGTSSRKRVYIADTYNCRIITFLVEFNNNQIQIITSSEHKFDLTKQSVYPSAIATNNYPVDYGLYVVDWFTGDIYIFNAELDCIVDVAQTNPAIYRCSQLSYMEGEAGAAEQWIENSGIQYFFIDSEVNNLQIAPSRIPQGAYTWAKFDLTGPAESIIATIYNSQEDSVCAQNFGCKGIDLYTLPLTEVANLTVGTYTVVLEAIDPYEGNENYTIHSSNTFTFIIEAPYAWNGFELNEPYPYTNSFLFNNCATNLTSGRISAENTTFLRPYEGSYMFKMSGFDNSSDEEYDAVDCRLFGNCEIPITNPTYFSCWLKAIEAPSGAESLYVSIDGIISDATHPYTQLKHWTEYGKPIDQYGQRIHAQYHPIPVDSLWHNYVFSLTSAAGDTMQIIQLTYWGVPSTATGQFSVYLDEISISSDHPWNMWYAETFGNGSGSSHTNGDPNFELGMSLTDEDGQSCYGGARIIVDGHGVVPGMAQNWILPRPSIRKDLHPDYQMDSTLLVSWLQYDKAHSLVLGFLIDDNWLYYNWNGDNHWDETGFVNMGDSGHVRNYDTWETFTRPIYYDYVTEYGSQPQELQAYQIWHECKSDWDGDSGGTIKGPVFTSIIDSSAYEKPTIIRPNGGERWVGGQPHWYIHYMGGDPPIKIAVWWTSNYSNPSPTWKLVDVREFEPLPPPLSYYVPIGIWTPPVVWTTLPDCAFKTQVINRNGLPTSGAWDESDSVFSIVPLMVRIPDELEEEIMGSPQPPGGNPGISWETYGVCGVEGIDLYYTTQGGMDEQQTMAIMMSGGGGAVWHEIATGLNPGTYQAVDSIYDEYNDTTYYEYAYAGHYDDWYVPNVPTSGGNFKLVAYDTAGDTAVYIMPGMFNIPFGGVNQYATAYSADKIVTDENAAHLVYADESANILYSSNDDQLEWEPVDTVGQGGVPSLCQDDLGNPCVAWVSGTENQQSIIYSQKVQGVWSTPVMIASPNQSGVTRYSESALLNGISDTLHISYFKNLGQSSENFHKIGLLDSRFLQSNPQIQMTDTVWGTDGSYLSPVINAPARLVDTHNDDHFAFNWNDSTLYIHITDTLRTETICADPSILPTLTSTNGNIYITYGIDQSGNTCIVQKWKHPQDTFWRGTDTLYKGSVDFIHSLGGAVTLLQSPSAGMTRLSFDPIERKVDTVPIADSLLFGHGGLCYEALDVGLPLVWTQKYGTSYYVATDWHDPGGTIFPGYYLEGGAALTPYTEHRDSTVSYYSRSVDWGSDSLVYRLGNLSATRNHTLFLEFYFDDDSLSTREYVITAGSVCDTVDLYKRFLKRVSLGIPAGDTAITVKITSDDGSVEMTRLMLYQGDEETGMMMMGAQDPEEVPLRYALYQNLPNPFSTTTRIRYALPYNRRVSIKVYDVAGRLARILVDEDKAPGIYEITWDGTDNTSVKLASGIYFIHFSTDDFRQTKKAVLFK